MVIRKKNSVKLSDEVTQTPKPFVKWAGGKTQLLNVLLEKIPQKVNTYYEPFVGGGAVFFSLISNPEFKIKNVVLNDFNCELIETYRIVRDELDDLINYLTPIATKYLAGNTEQRKIFFYKVRSSVPDGRVEKAARLLFLNKTCFNGLYRVNQKGEFNVPHGRYKNPKILDVELLTLASHALQNTELICGDFEDSYKKAKKGDFVYFDPPFFPLSSTSSFTSYTKGSFGRVEHLRLKWSIDRLRENNVAMMLSNSPHEWIVGLYEGSKYTINRTPARRSINAKGGQRGAIDELIVV
tara:strand:+ start:4682 stop:5569 length:888 start_codon:yes stop_codon:yes gene_type:complete